MAPRRKTAQSQNATDYDVDFAASKRDIQFIRESGILGDNPDKYTNASNVLGSWISAELVRMVNETGITQKNGTPYAGGMPKGFWMAPEDTIERFDCQLVGWPSGLPSKSPRNGWSIGMASSFARMLLQGSIRIESKKGRGRSSRAGPSPAALEASSTVLTRSAGDDRRRKPSPSSRSSSVEEVRVMLGADPVTDYAPSKKRSVGGDEADVHSPAIRASKGRRIGRPESGKERHDVDRGDSI